VTRRLVPRSMMARLALLMAVALCMAFAANSLLTMWEDRSMLSLESTARIAEQLMAADQILMEVAPPERRANVAEEMALQHMTLNWVTKTVITNSADSHSQVSDLRSRLEEVSPRLVGRDLRLNLIHSTEGGTRDLLGALRLADGSFVTFRVSPFLASPPPFALTTALHLLLAAIVLVIALLMMHALMRPLRDLADAADETRRGMVPDLEIAGPQEVQRVATAFRGMQARLLQTVEDHAQALVAVSHDLRTPIQRLRLRIALPPDDATRSAMETDLADMEKFIASVAAFLESGEEESVRSVDLAAIAMTMVDNAADAGAHIDYEGPDALPFRLKPATFKRALANLIDNGCRHGGRVVVSIETGEQVTVSVEDDGPGIAPEMREEVFLPFRRLNAARDGAGSGLGLAIVKKAVASLNGRIVLTNSPMGGLAARIMIGSER
jgi:two-component system osmolarity sensor histidine kinase EnvZ